MSSALVTASDEEVLAALTDLETEARKLASRQHAVIAEIETRHLAHDRGMKSTAVLLNRLLRITAAEATARVRAAADIGPRRGLTGESLEPIFPHIAEAQAEGAISVQHAKLVRDTVEKLPDTVRAEHEEQVEADLVGFCRRFDPKTVGLLAKRIAATLDPDGLLKDVEARHRRRRFAFQRRGDGSAFGKFELDAECAEHVQTVFGALAGPKPGPDGARDPRSTGQRWHDALLDLCQLGMRAQLLPSTAGVTTTVVLHGTTEAFETGDGLVTTGTGALIPAGVAKKWASSDSRFLAAVFNRAGRLVSYNSCTRLFTEGQRLALIARDMGCSFPGCTAPPAQCQAHHIKDWVKHGPTSVENGTLLCGFHHREFEALGWRCHMLDGIPHWIAPAWLDPDQIPQRNRAHDPVCVT